MIRRRDAMADQRTRMSTTPALPVLDADNARFIGGGVSIIVSSRNAANAPELVRAHGCRVSRDRRRVCLFLQAGQAGLLLADIRKNGRIAVVFTRPTTHRSLQLKGDDAALARLRPHDAARVAGYRDAMVAELEGNGISEALTRALLAGGGDGLVAIEFTPVAAFVQTPGPDAGKPLGSTP